MLEPTGIATTRGRSSRPSCRISTVFGSIFEAGAPSSQTTAGDGSGSLCWSLPGPAYLIFVRSFFWAAPSEALILPETEAASWGLRQRRRARKNLMVEGFYPSPEEAASRSGIEL